MIQHIIILLNVWKGDGITEDIDKAIYWYEKCAKQEDQDAQIKLYELQKNQ